MNPLKIWQLIIITGLLTAAIYYFIWPKWTFWIRVLYGNYLLRKAKRRNLSPETMKKIEWAESEMKRIAKEVKEYENNE